MNVSVGNGKYTVQKDETGRLTALRYGEPWRDCCGDNLILSLAAELEEARKEASARLVTGPSLTKREYFAAMETLADFDDPNAPAPIRSACESLAGTMPSEYGLDFLKWEAKWRAALKVIRADELIAALESKP